MTQEMDPLERCYRLQVSNFKRVAIRSENLDRIAAIVALMQTVPIALSQSVLTDRPGPIGPDDVLDAFRHVIDSVKGVTIDD